MCFLDLGEMSVLFPQCLQNPCLKHGADKFVPLNVYVLLLIKGGLARKSPFFLLLVLAALPVGIAKNFAAWQREEVTSLYPQIIQLSAARSFFCSATL